MKRRLAPDQYIITTCLAIKRQDGAGSGAKPSLDPVALNGPTQFLSCGEPGPDGAGHGIGAGVHLEDQTGLHPFSAPGKTQKVGAAGQPGENKRPGWLGGRWISGRGGSQAERRLRPCARRRATTLRPFLVAIRARNPCRRLRTMRLG